MRIRPAITLNLDMALGLLLLLTGIIVSLLKSQLPATGATAELNLDAIIPREFQDWKIDPSAGLLLVNPDSDGLLNKLYNQTLARTYINTQGDRIMLSIAYGADQRTDLHIHRPEICYVAGGFDISNLNKRFLITRFGNIPAMQLTATLGTRKEPITYWIRVGDTLTRGWFEQKMTSIQYGLSGTIPDGLLFRISSLSYDQDKSFAVQQAFLSDLLVAMQQQDRHWLIGKLSLHSAPSRNMTNQRISELCAHTFA